MRLVELLGGGAAGQGLVVLAANTDIKVLVFAFPAAGLDHPQLARGSGAVAVRSEHEAPVRVGRRCDRWPRRRVGLSHGRSRGRRLWSSRLAGGLILGFCIGLMVAIVEAAFRRAWLEVRYGPREMVTVNLGAEPVKVGSDAQACTVWARGAAKVALRYFIRDGQVVCTDVPSRSEDVVGDGDTREAGKVTVVVRTGSGTAPPQAPARYTAPRLKSKPAPPPVPATQQPLSLDDDLAPCPLSMHPSLHSCRYRSHRLRPPCPRAHRYRVGLVLRFPDQRPQHRARLHRPRPPRRPSNRPRATRMRAQRAAARTAADPARATAWCATRRIRSRYLFGAL